MRCSFLHTEIYPIALVDEMVDCGIPVNVESSF